MAYEKHTWTTGEVITAAKLNNMEDGIASAGGTLVIGGFSFDSGLDTFTGTADKTWQEIDTALAAGARCVVVYTGRGEHNQTTIVATSLEDGKYQIFDSGDFVATSTSADGYPVYGEGHV